MPDDYPPALQETIRGFSRLPGIGKRTAERLALALVDWDAETVRDLGATIHDLPDKLRRCRDCGNLAEAEQCAICRNPRRDSRVVCVVEHARQIPVIERTGRFHGLYHVLGGRLSPLEGVDVDDLNLQPLYARVADLDVQELILATSPDVEGEATASYLADELHRRFEVKLSRLASGVPVGSDLSYADAATMAMALDSRRAV